MSTDRGDVSGQALSSQLVLCQYSSSPTDNHAMSASYSRKLHNIVMKFSLLIGHELETDMSDTEHSVVYRERFPVE